MKKNLLFIGVLLSMTTIASAQNAADINAYLPFNGNIENISASGATVAKSGNAASPNEVTFEEGKFGQAGAFNQSLLVTTGLGFAAHGDFTIAAWINHKTLPSTLGFGQTWIHQKNVADEAPGRIHLEVVIGDYIGSFTSGVRLDNTNPDTTEILLDTWYHVAIVQDTTSKTKTLYVDGIKVNEITYDTAIEINNGEFVIGGPKNEAGNPRIRGGALLDDLLITKEILSETIINQIKNDGVAVAYGFSSSFGNVNESADIMMNYTDGLLNIKMAGQHVDNLQVFNLTGATVFESSESKSTYELNLPMGVYIVRANYQGATQSGKLLVK